ncbi:MAG: glycosyltransferase family 39 protein [Alphaproteobacteria bacterium]|nr:glycosyltransferase family 39 protein [Alphaproteobacteria bacterium]
MRTLLGAIPDAWRSDRAALWDRLALALLLGAAVLVLLTFADYGVTWDEDVHSWYGGYALDYYLSGFRDVRALHWQNLYNYGAAFDMAAAALNRFSPLGLYETRHLLNGIVGIAGLAGCWKFGRAMGGARAGLLALLFLLLTPNYYGQMFNNPKDIPFAVGFVWASCYMVRLLPVLPRPPVRLLVKLGVAIGLAMGVRIGGLLLLCYLCLLLGLYGAWEAAASRSLSRLAGLGWTCLWRVLGPVAAVAFAVMLVFWPWAQLDPLDNPLRALAFFSHETFPFTTLFDGRFVPAWDLPWTYLPTYIALALPELVLVLLGIAPVAAAFALGRRSGWRRDPVLAGFLLGFSIVFPIAYAIEIRAVLFDGMRHFLFVLPPIAVAAALAGDKALGRLERLPYRRPVYAALALYGIAHVSIMIQLHPDQYVYYNAFVGGVDGAQGKFKLDYWANSYAEAVRGLENYLRAEYGADFEEREFTVAVCGPPISADYYFPANFRFMHQRDKADFFIAFTKDDCDRSLPGQPVYRVERMGALLSVVLDRREILAEQRVTKRPYARAGLQRAPASAFP